MSPPPMTRCHAHRTPDGREILSDVVMRQDDQVLHHIHTTVDAHGHIQDLWRIVEKRPARQLAKFADERRAVAVEAGGQQGRLHPVGDLLTAQEENSQHRLYQYTERDQLQSYTDCSGKTSRWTYDERGRVKSLTDAAGGKTGYRYGDYPELSPGIGEMTAAEREAEGQRLRRERQNVGQLAEVTHPDGGRERYHHDAEGRLLEHTDGAGRMTRWQYATAGLLRARQDAAGRLLKYDWDQLGRLTRLTNENGATVEFGYDPVGRLLERKGFDGQKTAYRYDRDGRLREVREQDSVQRVRFDPAGRLVRQESGRIAADGKEILEETREFAWDRNGRLSLAKNEAARLQWFHDLAGNVIAEQQHYLGQGITAVWRYGYDPLGQRISTVRPDGRRIEHLSYGAGHVHGIVLDGETLASLERDDRHREVERTYPNGLTQTRTYDPAGRLKEQSLAPTPGKGEEGLAGEILGRPPVASGQRLKRSYSYDKQGQLTRIRESGQGEWNYRYDPAGRLIAALSPLGEEKFAFDPAGNPLDTRDVRRDAESGLALETEKPPTLKLTDNLLRAYRGTRYRYDKRGNLEEKDGPAGRMRFTWNSLDQLVQVETADTLTRFRYDPLGRRIVKHSEAIVPRSMNDGSQYHRLEVTRLGRERQLGRTLYGWEGDRLAWETTNERSLHYLYEPDSFVPLAQGIDNRPIVLHRTPDWKNREYRVKDDPLWQRHPEAEPFDELAFYHCDQIGTPREMTDGEGKLVWSAHYRAWGEAGILTEKVRNPLRFQGQYYDHETGLHYNRHRYYDPESGRYISKDPIGLAGGLNLYAYAPNPVRWVDPRGLAGCIFTLSTGRLVCAPSNSQNLPVDIAVASGNNAVNGSNGQPCRNNSTCTAVPNHGPIPLGKWRWVLYSSQPGQSGYTGKPNGRVLEPVPGTNTNITEQRTLIRSHSCAYPFGPGLGPRFCSEGCVTGTASDIQRLNQLLDAEPNSILEVVAQPLQPQSSQTPTQ